MNNSNVSLRGGIRTLLNEYAKPKNDDSSLKTLSISILNKIAQNAHNAKNPEGENAEKIRSSCIQSLTTSFNVIQDVSKEIAGITGLKDSSFSQAIGVIFEKLTLAMTSVVSAIETDISNAVAMPTGVPKDQALSKIKSFLEGSNLDKVRFNRLASAFFKAKITNQVDNLPKKKGDISKIFLHYAPGGIGRLESYIQTGNTQKAIEYLEKNPGIELNFDVTACKNNSYMMDRSQQLLLEAIRDRPELKLGNNITISLTGKGDNDTTRKASFKIINGCLIGAQDAKGVKTRKSLDNCERIDSGSTENTENTENTECTETIIKLPKGYFQDGLPQLLREIANVF